MRSQKFSAPPKGTTPNAEAYCVQRWSLNSMGGGRDIAWQSFNVKNMVFLAQNQSCIAENVRHPQKAQLLMLKHIVSKDEVPTPKGGWDIAWQSFNVKNMVF